MKIKKVEIKKYGIFKDHTILFGEGKIPRISFLVGNNGSGKTRLLDMIFHIISSPISGSEQYKLEISLILSDAEKAALNLTENELILIVHKDDKNNFLNAKYNEGEPFSLNRDAFQELAKVVYSTIEVNFNEREVRSVTSKNIDEGNSPKEKSQNLSNEIPQLLIDVKNLDDSEVADWVKENKNKDPFPQPPKNLGSRLERFTKAFHKIYGKEKTFSGIKNINESKKIIFVDSKGNEMSLNELSTGEKQIVYRIGYILKNLGNITGGIILIDEPEISLHPTWQIKLKELLHEIFDGYDVQIIIATHSPYIFKNLNEDNESCIKIDRIQPESKKISMTFPNVKYNPSVNLINYLAYGIWDELLHIELYTLLQIRENKDRITNSKGKNDGIENWLRDPSGGNMPIKQKFKRTGDTNYTEESIMTWIRNKIHHGDELARPDYKQSDLKDSIDKMIFLLQNP